MDIALNVTELLGQAFFITPPTEKTKTRAKTQGKNSTYGRTFPLRRVVLSDSTGETDVIES